MNKSRLLAGSVLAITMIAASAARAQDTPQAAAAERPASSSTNPNADIIVTAQFRSQRLQDTPIAISALSSEAIAQKGVSDIVGAANTAPNVSLSRNAGGFGQIAAIFIRGVGQSDPHFAVEPGVGMYVDDVYYGVLTGSIFQLLDTDRVEVLRGPQGTLAGKNSIGGAVKLFSKRPGPDQDGYVEAGYGSRNSILGRAASSFTLIDDKLFARISIAGKYSDGYMDRLDYACATGNFAGGTQRTGKDCKIGSQGGERTFTVRGSLRWHPNEMIDNTLIVDSTRDRSENPAGKALVQSPLWAGTANYITGAESYTNYETLISRPTGGSSAGIPFVMPDTTPLDAWGASNLLTVNFDNGLKLDSITALRSSKVTFSAQADATPASINDQVWTLKHRQFTQELRLSGDIGALADWTVGLYYYKATGESGGRVNIPGGLAPGGGGLNLDILFFDPVETESKSAFLHTIWHPVAGLNFTAAVRYTDDSKKFTFNRYDPNGSPHPLLGALVNFPVTYNGDRIDYRLGLDYEFSRNLMVYGQVSTGYKGGGVNPRPFFVTQALPYDPETLTAYEAGFKSQFLDRRVTLNVAAFYNKYKNFQSTLRRCDAISPFPGAPCAQSTNVGDANIKGVEVETVIEPIDGFSIDASLGYLDFEYTRVDPLTGITLAMTNVYTPTFSASAGAQYKFDIGGAGTVTPRLDYTHRSSMEGDAVNDPVSHIPGRDLLNAKLSWASADHNWEAAISVSNLTNKFYYESKFSLAAVPYFAAVGNPGEPRRWMFTIKRRFD